MRDALRRFMASAPDAWDYSGSDIPSGLTSEMEAAQQGKKVRRCTHVCLIAAMSV